MDDFYESVDFKLWVIIPKITAALSIFGSSLILRDVLLKRNRNKRLKATTNRIITLMSICDLIQSFVTHFLGTWLVPKDLGVWSTAGNQATCTIQGFVGVVSLASTALNASLAATYVLVVRFGWNDRRLQTPCMSFMLLGFPILFNLGFNVWPLVDQAFNWNGAWSCGIKAGPSGCSVTGDPYPCTRGLQEEEIKLAGAIWIQVIFAIIFFSTVALYWTVLEKERATDRYAADESLRNRSQSKRVAMQGIWYAGSFFLTYIFYWVLIIMEYLSKEESPIWLGTMVAVTVPLQGFFNAIIYFRPRFINKKKSDRSRSSSLFSRAIDIFHSRGSSRGSSTTVTASATGKGTEQCRKEEEKLKEEEPVPKEDP